MLVEFFNEVIFCSLLVKIGISQYSFVLPLISVPLSHIVLPETLCFWVASLSLCMCECIPMS